MLEVTMKRDVRARRKQHGYAAICALGFDADPGVFCVTATEDVEKLLPRFQLGTWHRLHFRYLAWTPGLVLARTLAAGIENTLADARLGHHWFRASLDDLEAAVSAECKRMRATTWTHEQLAAKLQAALDREADRFADGIF